MEVATTKQLVNNNNFSCSNIQERIDSVTKYQKTYIRKVLKKLAEESSENAEIICTHITAEQNEINIKESTKEGKIKCLIWLSSFHKHKSYCTMTKEDILNYLDSLRRPRSDGS